MDRHGKSTYLACACSSALRYQSASSSASTATLHCIAASITKYTSLLTLTTSYQTAPDTGTMALMLWFDW
jgi:hypothetical protein